MAAPQALPTQFPCWVRAVFSFGGESRQDLGFIEGDLIECLNAGDGSWWMGRLFRDKRMKGMFPSNFVEVLDPSFRPSTRTTSPMPQRSPSTSPFNPQPPQNAKSKPFRKAFSAYAAPNPNAGKAAELQKQDSVSTTRGRSPVPSVHDNIPRVPSPQIRGYGSRATSPAPVRQNSYNASAISPASTRQNSYNARAVSPAPVRQNSYNAHAVSPAPMRQNSYNSHAASSVPERQNSYNSRARSPAPPTHNGYGSRAPSPSPHIYDDQYRGSRSPSPAPQTRNSYGSRAPSPGPYAQYNQYSQEPPSHPQFDIGSSPPPPAPPPHRTQYTPQRSENKYNSYGDSYNTPRAVSPRPASPDGTGLTPSPLRSAMDDVMSSLADMGVSGQNTSPETPLDPWSPEAFDQTYIKARRNGHPRPNTAMGLEGSNVFDEIEEPPYGGSSSSRYADQPPPQLSNYVQRMENRLSKMHNSSPRPHEDDDLGPAVPPKMNAFERPKSSMGGSMQSEAKLRHRKSAYEVGKSMLGRTFTTKTNSTSSSSGARSTTTNGTTSSSTTDRSLMSGPSASGFSYTSAGSLARKKEALNERAHSAFGSRREAFSGLHTGLSEFAGDRPETPLTGISFHSSHASGPPRAQSQAGWHGSTADSGMLGGLTAPKPKKSGFFKKIIESAKTGAASARGSIVVGELPRTTMSSKMPIGISSISGGGFGNSYDTNAANDMGIGGGNAGIDWVQVRRDVNRANSLSRIEIVERKERCQMMDYPAISSVDELYEQCDGDEGAHRRPVAEPTNFQAVNLSLVDKNARFINSLPPMTNPVSLATGFVCRPYRSDVQRLRAIFTWVSEKITWEEDFDTIVDCKRVLQTKRGSSEEVSVLVLEMCAAVGIQAEIVRGYLKTPGEIPELAVMPRPNHWWNAVLVDGEWRMMDCSLASPSHPRRGLYSRANSQCAESWWFLARPSEICWTHVPDSHHQQHLCPPIAFEILLALPCACPPYFKNGLQMVDYDTSLIRIEDLETVQLRFNVPADVECVAYVEAKAFERDGDGDFFESGETIKKRALAQAEWVGGQKRYTVKALLPGDEGQGTLKVYAGKRGLMQSIKDDVHPLAFALPIIHTGDNPPFDFVTRYPTPHAQRHDIYVSQPQCQRLAFNNTFVFAIRQHPSSLAAAPANFGGTSPIPFARPTSSMSMTSSSASGSNPSTTNTHTSKKSAKLAIQAPGGKVLRLMRKEEKGYSTSQGVERADGGTWETIIKVTERGTWRGLVLADRSARWCVFAEWTCV